MGIVDPIAMTNAMATGVMQFDGTAVWLTLFGLLIGSAGSLFFSSALPWRPSLSRLPRIPHLGPRPAPLAK
jgi:hypothetical protein